MIDEKSMKKYKKYKGEYRRQLLENIDKKEKCFTQKDNRRCAFLNDDNLCEMYINAGKDMLCKTCRRYPRHFEEFENYRVVNLSMSCPEVARIILGRKSKVKFKYMTTSHDEKPYDYFDFLLFTKLQQMQEFMINTLQDRTLDLKLRIGLVLGCAHDIQKRIDSDQLFEIDSLLEKYSKETFRKKAIDTLKNMRKNTTKTDIFKNRARIFMNLHRLEILNSHWAEYMTLCEEIIFSNGIDFYHDAMNDFEDKYKDRMVEFEQILIYFISTYFLGAVYDGRMYDKVVFAVASMMFIEDMDMATFIMNEGELTFNNQVDIVHRYSRELEHSDPNVELLEEMIAKQEEYRAENMITSI